MKRNIIVLSVFSIVVYSCTDNHNNTINNDIRNVSKVNIEDIAYDIEIKPIISNEPIESVMSLSGNDCEFVALDNKLQNMYLIENGNIIAKLNSVGRGPNEYSNITEIAYSPIQNVLYAYSPDKKCIFCYETPTFDLIKKICIVPEITAMYLTDKDNIILSCYNYESPAENDYGIFILDPKTESMNKVTNTNYINSIYTSSSSFFTKGDTVYFTLPNHENPIFEYSDNKLTTRICVNYHEMNFSDQLCDTNGNETTDMIKYLTYRDDEDYAIGCYYLYISDTVISYWHHPHVNKKYFNYFTICKNNNCQNYIIGIKGLNINIFPLLFRNNTYMTVIEGDWQKLIDKSQPLSPTGEKIIEYMKQQNDNNPIVLSFKMRYL